MKQQTTTDLKMKYDIDHMISAVGETCQDLINNKTLILGVLATSGFVQVVLETASFQLEFVGGNIIMFLIVCALGYVKHNMTGERNEKEFIQKSLVNLSVTVCIISFLYAIALVFNGINRIASDLIPGNPVSSGSAAYFIYTGHLLAFAFNIIKAKALFDFVAPKAIPEWVMRPFVNFRKTGKVADLLKGDTEEKKEP